jgi:hypothetical protein
MRNIGPMRNIKTIRILVKRHHYVMPLLPVIPFIFLKWHEPVLCGILFFALNEPFINLTYD